MEKNNQKRYGWISLLKIIAILLVIVLHTIDVGIFDGIKTKGIFIYYFGTIAIPLFFSINGYLLLQKERNYSYVLKKIKKILIIVVFWNILFFAALSLVGKKECLVSMIVGSLIQKSFFQQFWFLGSLIIIYLFLPILSKLFNEKKGKKYKILTLIIILICVIINMCNIFLNIKYDICIKEIIPQTFRLWTWLCYFCLGGYLNKNNIMETLPKITYIFLIIITLSIFVKYEISFSKIMYGNLYAENFYDSFFCFILTILVFTFFRNISIKDSIVIDIMGNLTMGVYIFHTIIIKVLNRLFAFDTNFKCIILFLLTSVISFVISYMFYNIPKIKELIKI